MNYELLKRKILLDALADHRQEKEAEEREKLEKEGFFEPTFLFDYGPEY